MKRRVLNINTNMFNLVIYYNKSYVGVQLAIFAGLLLISLFSRTEVVDQMCLIILIFDIIVLLFILLNGASIQWEDLDIETADDKCEVKQPQDTTPMYVKVDHTKKSKSNTTESNQVINNKVPIPNDTITPVHETAPAVEELVKPETPIAGAQIKNVSEMTSSDWDEIFGSLNDTND